MFCSRAHSGRSGAGGAQVEVALGILGETWFRAGGRRRGDWGHPKDRGLFAALLTQAGRTMSVEVLRTWVWAEGEEPDHPVSTLQLYVGRIRTALKAVEGVELVSEYRGYRVDVDRALIDYFAFGELVTRARSAARQGDHQTAHATAARAVQLWRGVPLVELDSERARNWRRSVVENEWIPANAVLIEACIALGDLTDAVRRLDELEREYGDSVLLAKLRLLALHGQYRAEDAIEYYLLFHRRMREIGDDESAAEIHRYHERFVARSRHRESRVRTGRPPDQLPEMAPDFTGREDLLADLDSAFGQGFRLVVVNGSGGVGKTALVARWGRMRRDDFLDGTLFFNLNGFSPVAPAHPDDVVDSFLTALGFEPDRIPTAQGRAARLRELMADQQMLVVLDNARDSAHVQTLLPLLGPSMVVVTSRLRLVWLAARGGARVVKVDPLDLDQAVALLAGRIGARVDADRESAVQLVGLCGRFPLALNLVAEHISGRRGAPLADFVPRLRGPSLLKLGGHDDAGTMSLEKVFEFSYLALNPLTQRIFRLLGRYPGVEFSGAAANALAGADTEDALTELVEAHLLDQSGALDRYQFHDVLRGYAAILAERDEYAEDRVAAERRLLSFYLHSAANAYHEVFPYWPGVPLVAIESGVRPVDFTDDEGATAWFEQEYVNISSILNMAVEREHHEIAWRIPHVVVPALIRYAHMSEAKRAWEIAVSSARVAGDEDGEGSSLNDLGLFLLQLGDHDAAQPWFELGLRFAERVGNDTGIAASLHNIARVEAARRRYPQALELFERALDVAVGSGNGMIEAATMHKIGETCRLIRRYDQALNYLQQSLFLRRRMGNAHGQGESLVALGLLYADSGDVTNALGHCGQAVALSERIRDAQVERDARLALAEIHIRLPKVDLAVDHAVRAVELARATWHRNVEARGLDLLGQAWLVAGRYEPAADAWREALAIYEDRGDVLLGRAVQARLDALAAAGQVPGTRDSETVIRPSSADN
jgi:tetratricopeptide (TPR) repeat protein